MDHTARRLGRGSLIDLLVVAGVIAVLVVIVGPAVRSSSGDKRNRIRCANNLRQLGVANIAYLVTAYGPASRKGFMPHLGEIAEKDGPEDVGRAFELLVQLGEIDDPEVFICPSSFDIPARLAAGAKPESFRFKDTDVRSSLEFSYGYTKLTRTDGNSRSSTLLTADRTMGKPRGEVGREIVCHPDGRNVGRFDGSVDFIAAESELEDAELREQLGDLNLLPLPAREDVREAVPEPEPELAPGTLTFVEACRRMVEGMEPYSVARAVASAEGTGWRDLDRAAGMAGDARKAFSDAVVAVTRAKREVEGAGGDPESIDPSRLGETLGRLVEEMTRLEADLKVRAAELKKAGK